ncbi:hypothetical protein LAX5112_03299 [Roseibium alexandrii]|uniref:Uncharacterized protein n=1 Tax=Roseibium alexandrii TaxID=388408 RepID=A0A0M7AGQ3_9HYPH|nr:hypothetical protein LAX5112_03299 [Roseibium alexandrii]
MTSRPSYKQRLAKKAERQRDYRRRIKKENRPTRNDITATLFHYMVRRTDKIDEWKKFNGLMSKVTDALVERGFDRAASEKAIDSLVDRIVDGQEFRRRLPPEDA